MTSIPSSLFMRYDAPAGHFNEALPVGNGRLGAMVFGQTHRERLTLNEDSCWAGSDRDRLNPGRAGAVDAVRTHLFEKRFDQAADVARRRVLATPLTIDSYQPMGELELRVGWRGPVTDYRRWLDLDGAVAVCEWREGVIRHRRTVFASGPDQVLVVRHEVDATSPPPFALRLVREGPATRATDAAGDLLLTGHANAHASRHGCDAPSSSPGGRGTPVAVRVRAVVESGEQTILADRLQVTGARAVTFVVAMATAFREADPAAACGAALARAAQYDYARLLDRHQADHRRLFRQFDVSFAAPADDGRTVPERLDGLRAGAADPGFFALVMQHRRYLLIAASRPGSLPSNLQGIWTDQQQCPWNGDYHFNINLQMNYWPAEPTGLGECAEPLIDYVESLVPNGEHVARELYGCRGWVLHHLSDCWKPADPFDGLWGLWPWGGVWLCLHLHDHWSYARDRGVLDRVWPILRGAVRFVLDYLIEAPPSTAHAGLLTTCPSHSPENKFLDSEGKPRLFTYGSTMDFALCRALFDACLVQSESLDADADLREEIRVAARRLPPPRVSPTTGGIQEWAEDYAEADPGHRHTSHLFDLYPGHAVSPDHTPALAAAAEATLRRKARHQSADSSASPGWALNWNAAHWCRLGDGTAAMAKLHTLLRHTSAPNLMTFAHDQPQVADACGTAAVLCEMLVRSGGGVVRLLPALPDALSAGRVTGLRLPDALTLEMEWDAARIKVARITATRPTTLRVASRPGSGMSVSGRFCEANAAGEWSADLSAGDVAIIRPATE